MSEIGGMIMILILGVILLSGIVLLILNRFFEGMNVGIWLANFLSWAALLSVLFVWLLNMGISTRDYAYMEAVLDNSDPNANVEDERFLELYLKYKMLHRLWINRQFNAKPPDSLRRMFADSSTIKARIMVDD